MIHLLKKLPAFTILISALLTTGCTINHPIAKDYSQYLANNTGTSALPESSLKANYVIDEKTTNHRYEFRAATVGYAHLWIVEFGQILESTLQSQDVQSAFTQLSKAQTKTKQNEGDFISFNLVHYRFEHHRAFITLNIDLSRNGKTILNKNYTAEGKSQGGKMFWGGPFAMKNATQQSTKVALDTILKQFIADTATL